MSVAKIAVACLFMTFSLAAPGCSKTGATPPMPPPPDRPPAVTASAAEIELAQSADADFAIELYGELAKEHPGENLFFSPFSVSSALLIAAEGATGETAEQMGRTLRFPKSVRNTGADAATVPWTLAGLHKGQAAIQYRLAPGPTPIRSSSSSSA